MTRLILAVALCTYAALASAAGTFDWKKALELPLSPGAVAILVENGGEPEVQERWRSALKAEVPEVRAAAARAVYGAGATNLAPALKEALAAEKHPGVAAEEIRALAALGAPEDDATIVEAARRPPAVRVLAWLHLGRARGTAALVHLAAAREIDGTRDDRQLLVRAAIRGGRAGLDQASEAALRQSDPAVWWEVWNGRLSGGTVDEGHVTASLSAADPSIRAISYWNLAALVAGGNTLSESITAALQTAPEARADSVAPPKNALEREAHVAFSLLKKARGGKRSADMEWVRDARALPGPAIPVADLLTKDERKVLMEKHLLHEGYVDAKRYLSVQGFAKEATRTRTVVPQDFPPTYASSSRSWRDAGTKSSWLTSRTAPQDGRSR